MKPTTTIVLLTLLPLPANAQDGGRIFSRRRRSRHRQRQNRRQRRHDIPRPRRPRHRHGAHR